MSLINTTVDTAIAIAERRRGRVGAGVYSGRSRVVIERGYYALKSSTWMVVASGFVEPIAGVIGAAAVLWMRPMLPYALSFAAGAMIYVVVEELIPEWNFSFCICFIKRNKKCALRFIEVANGKLCNRSRP